MRASNWRELSLNNIKGNESQRWFSEGEQSIKDVVIGPRGHAAYCCRRMKRRITEFYEINEAKAARVSNPYGLDFDSQKE